MANVVLSHTMPDTTFFPLIQFQRGGGFPYFGMFYSYSKGTPIYFLILTLSSFLAFIAISLKFGCRTEPVWQRKHWVCHKNGQKHPLCDQPMIPLSHWLSATN